MYGLIVIGDAKMEKMQHNIFLHFLNKDTQDIFGLMQNEDANVLKRLRRGLKASILLCKEFCIIPLGFYFESINTRQLLLENFEFLQAGLLRVCIRETDIKEYIEKKQGQLKSFANSISTYQGFYSESIEKKIIAIDPVFIKRNVRVGDYCIEKWVTQHNFLTENNEGDMLNVYGDSIEAQDLAKITIAIKKAAIETKNGAFVWQTVENKLKEIGMIDEGITTKLRIYFEKYYYEAYLQEYDARILYDFFILDRGNDFYLKQEYTSITNYTWFYEYIKILGIEQCIDLPSSEVIKLRYLPEFNQLMNVYVEICNDKCFDGAFTIRSLLSRKIINNEDNIKELIDKVKAFIKKSGASYYSFTSAKNETNNVDVLIIVATEDEENAILSIEKWNRGTSDKGYTYYTRNEGKSLALIRSIEARETSVSVIAQHFIDFLNPTYIAMAGFCAGNKNDVVLGDVIIPSTVYKYGVGEQKGEDEFLPEIRAFNLNRVC